MARARYVLLEDNFGSVLVIDPTMYISGETLRKQKKKKRRLFSRSVFQTLAPDKDKTEGRMTKSLNAGTRTEDDKEDVGAETLGESDTPTIRVSEASDDGDTVTAAISQTLSRCLIPSSDSISSGVYIREEGSTLFDKKIVVFFTNNKALMHF